MKTSEQIKGFLDFLHGCPGRYESAKSAVITEDKRVLDFLHAVEFGVAAEDPEGVYERLRESRATRRANKDTMEELDPVVEFLGDPANRKILNHLTQLLGKVRKAEKYHENRVYYPRADRPIIEEAKHDS